MLGYILKVLRDLQDMVFCMWYGMGNMIKTFKIGWECGIPEKAK